MEEMIHVLKVTANASDADGAEAEIRHSLIAFVRCEDEGSAYAPADAYLRQTGWQNVELVTCKALPPEAVEKLDESLQNAYREAVAHGIAAVLLKSS
jgi:hypothetical protein